MNIFADRVKETTTTTGTGDITLLGAVAQFQSFDTALTNGDIVSVAIVGQTGTEWELCIGTFVAPSTIQRTTVVASSNANAAVTFSAGTKDVFLTFSAGDVADVRARANHTGTQAISTVTGLQTELDGKSATGHTHAATDITSGTLPDAVFPAALPAASGANLTDLNASNLASGTVADARLSGNVPLEDASCTFSVNGAASTPAVRISGTIFTGGTGTTTKPQFLIEPSGTTSTGWSTSGTMVGVNAPSGFAGNLFDFKVNDSTSSRIYGTANGTLVCSNFAVVSNSAGISLGVSSDVFIVRDSAFTLQIGSDASSPQANTFKGPDARAGTDTNTAGGILNIAAGRGTGTAAGGELRLQTSEPTSSGTAAGTLTTRLAISGTAITASKAVVLPAYTLAQLDALTGKTTDMIAVCTDALAPTYLTAITGGGSVRCPAYYNGTAWVAH